jgi:hypothetical protein
MRRTRAARGRPADRHRARHPLVHQLPDRPPRNQRYLADFVGFLVVPALVLWLVRAWALGRARARGASLLGAAVGVTSPVAAMATSR